MGQQHAGDVERAVGIARPREALTQVRAELTIVRATKNDAIDEAVSPTLDERVGECREDPKAEERADDGEV